VIETLAPVSIINVTSSGVKVTGKPVSVAAHAKRFVWRVAAAEAGR
jgi:hypothetical protein